MKNNTTIYSNIVKLKKKIIKKRILPEKIASHADNFFNCFHNFLFTSKDLILGYLIRTKDLTRDSLIRTKDLTRDSLIRTKDLTRDSLIRTKDLTRDSLICTKDITKDISNTARNSYSRCPKPKKNDSFFRYLIFFPILASELFNAIILSLTLRKFLITSETDQQAVKNIDVICVNSKNVQARVKRFYGKNSFIVYPPVNMKKSRYIVNGSFWLSVNRLTPEKRIDMQVGTFNKIGEDLIIVGGYDDVHLNYATKLKKLAKDNIAFVYGIDESELNDLYANCKGFVTTSRDEDFGMTAVEAMAAGKPVIAPNEGGYKETVINGKTGILINNINEDKIVEAIRKIGKNPEKYKNACIKRAKKFDTSIFIKKIKKQLRKNG